MKAIAPGMTVGEALEAMTGRFEAAGLVFGHGVDNAWDEAVVLLLSVLGIPPDQAGRELLERVLSTRQAEAVEALARRRIEERLPAPYLTGEAWFCGLRFLVDRNALIPRSPIAELIEHAFSPWLPAGLAVRRILDIGTGSGCIAIACARAFPEAEVDAVDISQAALALTRRNIALHGLEGRVRAIESDIFSGIAEDRHYELIVSNPPYVSEQEMATLPDEYRHEPELGLVADEHGLALVRRILAGAVDRLPDDGLLVCEVGNSEQALVEAYPEIPFTWVEFARGGSGVFVLTADELRRWFSGGED